MIRFIHTADIHFGMENYGKIDSITGIHSRLLDFERALNYCIDVAIDKDVDFFLFSGDAYKVHNPTQTQQKLLMRCLLRLYQKNIPVVIVVGNHDNPLSFGKTNALELFCHLPCDGFHVFSKPGMITLPTKSGSIQIVGIPWPTRNSIALSNKHLIRSCSDITRYIEQAVLSIINNYAQELDRSIPSVLASHLTVSTGIFSGSEKRAIYGRDPVFMPSQLAIEPFDYVALGHLHRHQNVNDKGYPPLVYAGSIERIDFGERKEDKGFCLVTIHKKGDASYEFITGPMRPFIQIDVQLKEGQPHTEQLVAAIREHDVRDSIVKILYRVPEKGMDTVDLRAIQTACSAAMDLVSVTPIMTASTRERRAGSMSVDMGLERLLKSYFSTKDEYKNQQDVLINKAMALLDEIEGG